MNVGRKKAALGLVSGVLLISWGGQLLLPCLTPLYVWAARRSGRGGRVMWSIIPVAGAGVASWALVYVWLGELEPAIWLLPVIAGAATGIAMAKVTDPLPTVA
jgi:hypothetical protein